MTRRLTFLSTAFAIACCSLAALPASATPSAAAIVARGDAVILAQAGSGTAAPAATAPATAPATSTATPATQTPANTQATGDDSTKSKKKAKKMTRQQEIDKSVESGTVPSRYKSSIPKEYQQYIPWSKQ